MHKASGVESKERQALRPERKGALSFLLKSDGAAQVRLIWIEHLSKNLLTFWGPVQFSLGLLSWYVQSHCFFILGVRSLQMPSTT